MDSHSLDPASANSTSTSRDSLYVELRNCRLCHASSFDRILDLGHQSLSGVFPKSAPEAVPRGPLALVKCRSCDLVQLAHSYNPTELYGETYGYRSGLNNSMVRHLHRTVERILSRVALGPGDLIIDIGSNDGTLLGAYKTLTPTYAALDLTVIGIDPTAEKFSEYYAAGITLIPEFFTADLVRERFGDRKARIITSIAMFYDLEDPPAFVHGIRDILHDDGIWAFEQSYLPLMLNATSYDTVCHEHLEYYALRQIKAMMDGADLKIVHVELNYVNGGSFLILASPRNSPHPEATAVVSNLLAWEEERGLSTLAPYTDFRNRAAAQRDGLLAMLQELEARGERVLGYGASTKGNVILQYCGLGPGEIPCIADVNEDKFGAFTPGTGIPIVSEETARAMKPDVFLVLPWHFRQPIIEREREFLRGGGRLLFPLPDLALI